MGAEGAAEIVFRREIDAADDPQRRRQELIDLTVIPLLIPLWRQGGGWWMTSSSPRKLEGISPSLSNPCTPNVSFARPKSMV